MAYETLLDIRQVREPPGDFFDYTWHLYRNLISKASLYESLKNNKKLGGGGGGGEGGLL